MCDGGVLLANVFFWDDWAKEFTNFLFEEIGDNDDIIFIKKCEIIDFCIG